MTFTTPAERQAFLRNWERTIGAWQSNLRREV